ncbi:MAG TPA: hypothetical protein VKJ07_12560 [Mycobacteriales bacterium]|nr:hypothetical protein [Mycobacteriales bacterium]
MAMASSLVSKGAGYSGAVAERQPRRCLFPGACCRPRGGAIVIDNRPEAEPTGETEMALLDVVIDVSDANALRDGTALTATAEQVETMGKILTAVLGRAPLGY